MILRFMSLFAMLMVMAQAAFAITIEESLKMPGFQTYSTPRTFDGPGTVFYIAEDGQTSTVTVLTVPIQNAGTEEFASYQRDVRWDTSALFGFLGLSKLLLGGGGGASAGHDLQVVIRLGTGHRSRTFDKDVEAALQSANIKYAKTGRYYLVREVIAVDSIEVSASPNSNAELDAKIAINRMAKAGAEVQWRDASKNVLSRKFDTPHNLFYVAQKIGRPGIGMSQSGKPRLYDLAPDEILMRRD